MRRLGAWGAAAILATAANGAWNPAAAGAVDVDPGAPGCASGAAEPRCSLRAALDAANAAGGGVIRLAAGSVHTLTAIAAVNGLEGGSGLPSVTTDVTIEGNGAIVERSAAPDTPPFRIFHVAPQGRLTLRDLTVRNGLTDTHTDGGGLWNIGTLVLERVMVTDNAAGDDGGGIRNDGVLRMMGSFVIANRADGEGGTGGGLYNLPVAGVGQVTILDTVLRGNRAGDRGGAIWNSGAVSLEGSTLEGNIARVGGGAIRNVGSVSLTRCRIVGNVSQGRAGGVSALGPVEAADTTIAENLAPIDPDYEGDLRIQLTPTGRPHASAGGSTCWGHGSVFPIKPNTQWAGSLAAGHPHPHALDAAPAHQARTPGLFHHETGKGPNQQRTYERQHRSYPQQK